MREQSRKTSLDVAFCALLAALGAVVMAAGGLIPIATYCSPIIASALLLPVLSERGEGWAWMTWAVTAGLALLLSADREAAFLCLFLGYTPVLRPHFDTITAAPLRFLCKLLFFTLALGAMYALLIWVLRLGELPEELGSAALWMNALFFAALVAVMMIYDLALARLQLYWLRVLRPRLRRGGK